ncbi:immunity 22 family protein [Priestia megaterium]|uniref:immunity 22 family protein n=1 Tax=Priestia megaterium TaxID=1404 RepID=UPI002363B3CC|nr:immunity 22 family protein [Priestia megaterium]MDD1511795.1 immunity 22 family protein [Priestia megaterium]
MEQVGYVSLWIGKFSTSEKLEKYLLVAYTEEGDAIPSQFEKDFKVDYYDEDFSEAHYAEQDIRKLSRLLEGCSYDDVVIPNFVEKYGEYLPDGFTSMILIYDFQHNKKSDNEINGVKYLGSIRYE